MLLPIFTNLNWKGVLSCLNFRSPDCFQVSLLAMSLRCLKGGFLKLFELLFNLKFSEPLLRDHAVLGAM